MKEQDAPCYKCAERKVGCHSTCTKYADMKKRNEDKARKIKDNKNHNDVHRPWQRLQRKSRGLCRKCLATRQEDNN